MGYKVRSGQERRLGGTPCRVTDTVTVFVTCQALTRSSQNSEVGTVLANFLWGTKEHQFSNMPRTHSLEVVTLGFNLGYWPRLGT